MCVCMCACLCVCVCVFVCVYDIKLQTPNESHTIYIKGNSATIKMVDYCLKNTLRDMGVQ